MITEAAAAVTAGMAGLVLLAGGSTLTALPPIDRPIEAVIRTVQARRPAVLAGSLMASTGTGLLLWPVTAATTASEDVWRSLALFSVAVAALGAMFLAASALATIALAWPSNADLHRGTARVLHQVAHLATWSVSAPVAAVFVIATTAAAAQAHIAGPALVTAAVFKIVTIGVEIIGIGQRTGWNAGGWARGASGYATVLWYAALLLALATA